MNKHQFEVQLDDRLKKENGWDETRLAAHKVERAVEQSKREARAKERKFIDPQGYDWTPQITDDEKEKLFYEMCTSILNCKRPLNECFKDVANVLNIGRKLNGGEGPAVVIQGNPNHN